LSVRGNALKVVKELERTLGSVDEGQGEAFVEAVLKAKTVFIAGAGRSGLMARGFAMRLMHMGFDVHVAGDATTPAIQKGDLLIVCSGSGETASLASMVKKAAELGAGTALVTIFPDSTIGRVAQTVVRIQAPTPKGLQDNGTTSIQPMGSLFEQSLLIFLDSAIMGLMEKKGLDSDRMFARHANLE
jgi:6-phospho-3-hexuloisomerase